MNRIIITWWRGRCWINILKTNLRDRSQSISECITQRLSQERFFILLHLNDNRFLTFVNSKHMHFSFEMKRRKCWHKWANVCYVHILVVLQLNIQAKYTWLMHNFGKIIDWVHIDINARRNRGLHESIQVAHLSSIVLFKVNQTVETGFDLLYGHLGNRVYLLAHIWLMLLSLEPGVLLFTLIYVCVQVHFVFIRLSLVLDVTTSVQLINSILELVVGCDLLLQSLMTQVDLNLVWTKWSLRLWWSLSNVGCMRCLICARILIRNHIL